MMFDPLFEFDFDKMICRPKLAKYGMLHSLEDSELLFWYPIKVLNECMYMGTVYVSSYMGSEPKRLRWSYVGSSIENSKKYYQLYLTYVMEKAFDLLPD
jgi:hypothetical protein